VARVLSGKAVQNPENRIRKGPQSEKRTQRPIVYPLFPRNQNAQSRNAQEYLKVKKHTEE
jgi:hypothetical protein